MMARSILTTVNNYERTYTDRDTTSSKSTNYTF